MRYNYIEIGTSNFNTIVQNSDSLGISIEPLDFYLNQLPNKKNNTKLNVAITDQDGEATIYYVSPEDINKYNLPNWMLGCNSMYKKHPSVSKVLKETNLEFLYKTKKVPTLSWDTLIKTQNITGIDYLKIDTEGFDYKIIEYILNSKTNILPKKILFETNILTSKENILNCILSLKTRGYKVSSQNNENTEVILENTLPDKIIFSSDDSQYLNFWKHNSEICSKILNITPVLLYITDEESDPYWDDYGIIIKIKKDQNLPNLSQTIRLYSGVYFPEEYIMISDIDMFLFDKSFLIQHLKNHKTYDVTIIGSDAYSPQRPEMKRHLKGKSKRWAMCYIFTKGKILNQIMNLTLDKTLQDFYSLNSFNYGFNSDEVVFTENLINSNFKINEIERGYQHSFYLKDRIEKIMFSPSSSTFTLDLSYMDSLKGYIDCHCPPYNQNQEKILYIKNLILSRN